METQRSDDPLPLMMRRTAVVNLAFTFAVCVLLLLTGCLLTLRSNGDSQATNHDQLLELLTLSTERVDAVESRLEVLEANPATNLTALSARVKTLEGWMWAIEQAKNLKRKQEYDDEREARQNSTGEATPSTPSAP